MAKSFRSCPCAVACICVLVAMLAVGICYGIEMYVHEREESTLPDEVGERQISEPIDYKKLDASRELIDANLISEGKDTDGNDALYINDPDVIEKFENYGQIKTIVVTVTTTILFLVAFAMFQSIRYRWQDRMEESDGDDGEETEDCDDDDDTEVSE